MALTKLINLLWTLHWFFSHTKIKVRAWYIIHAVNMWKTPKAKTTFESSVFRGLKSLGARPTGLHLLSTRFDSTQWGHHITWGKLTWQVWKGGGTPLCLVHVLTQRKKDGCHWGFWQTLIFFQKDFSLAF